MQNLKAIVFDLDDTLYPERQYVHGGMHAVAAWGHRQFGYPAERTAGELLELFAQHGSGTIFDSWLRDKGLELDEWLPSMVDAYRAHSPSISPHDGVRELLARLRHTYRLGLVTDGHLAVQQAKVTALGLEALIDAIVYSDELGREHWKPSVRPYQKVLSRLMIPPEHAVYVGDNPAKDFRGARELGMWTVRVRHPSSFRFQRESPTPQDAPDLEIPDLGQLDLSFEL